MSFFDQVKGSITDWDLYNSVAHQKAGQTFKYFFIIFTILFLITGTKTAIGLKADFHVFAQEFQEKVPEFSLQDGEFSFSGEQPYILEGEQGAALVIDTTGATDQAVLDNYLDGVLITKDKMFIKQEYQIRQINFKDFRGTNFDKEKVSLLLGKLQWLILVIMVIGYVAQLAGKMITSVFLSIVGMFISNSQKADLKFGLLWNVSIYAMTLPMLLEAGVKLVYPQLPYFFLIYFGVGIAYTAKAVNHIIDCKRLDINPE